MKERIFFFGMGRKKLWSILNIKDITNGLQMIFSNLYFLYDSYRSRKNLV